jgi:formylglycine-generating enzyme required for sulfatase activity
MHGNVLQWTHDGYDDKTFDRGESVDRASYRVLRGGCWRFVAGLCRAAYRLWSAPAARNPDLGFRLARVPVEGK